jgi:hypothetical protein
LKLHYSRLIKTVDIELFNVQETQHSFESIAFLLFIDLKRESKLSDFPILTGVETEEDFDSTQNHIKVLQISPVSLSREYVEDLMLFAESMLSHTVNSSFYIHEIINDINLIEFSQLDIKPLLNFVESLIEEENKKNTRLNLESFKYLTQTV